jgi:hypothetical protein
VKRLVVTLVGAGMIIAVVALRPPTASADDSIKWYSPWRDVGCAHLCSSRQPHCKCQGLPDIIAEE